MNYLKQLMGSAWHEGVTVEEVNSFLAGKKLVDLNSGEYVAKDKYNNLEAKFNTLQTEHNTLKEQTKDFESYKTKVDEYEKKEANAKLKEVLVKNGVNESYFDYVKLDIDGKKLEVGDDDKVNKTNIEKYLKEHPQFASKPAPAVHKATISTNLGEPKVDPNDEKARHDRVNAAIRAGAGIKID